VVQNIGLGHLAEAYHWIRGTDSPTLALKQDLVDSHTCLALNMVLEIPSPEGAMSLMLGLMV
jgi:hypothetical protein